MTKNEKKKIILDALHNFPTLPIRTLARYILAEHGEYFDGNLESIRHAIRYVTGKEGETNRKTVGENVVKRGPVAMPLTWRVQKDEYDLGVGKWLVMGDIHVPFHDMQALSSAIKYAQAQKVTGVLLNGDIQDCAAVSHWPTTVKRNFDKEVASTIQFLDYLCQEFPTQKIVYKMGNHEGRLPRYYASKAPELIGLPLLAMDNILGLDYRGIDVVEWKQIVNAGKLPILHGDEYRMSAAVNAARGLFLKAKSWAMMGHLHTTSEHSARDIRGTLITTWSHGCLCDLGPDYAPFNDWNHGFAIIDVHKDGNFKVDNRRILPNGEVV
jgi:predicted phosphodiesterase